MRCWLRCTDDPTLCSSWTVNIRASNLTCHDAERSSIDHEEYSNVIYRAHMLIWSSWEVHGSRLTRVWRDRRHVLHEQCGLHTSHRTCEFWKRMLCSRTFRRYPNRSASINVSSKILPERTRTEPHWHTFRSIDSVVIDNSVWYTLQLSCFYQHCKLVVQQHNFDSSYYKSTTYSSSVQNPAHSYNFCREERKIHHLHNSKLLFLFK